MFVKFVPSHGGECKHAKIQAEPSETFSCLSDKLAKQFNVEKFKVLYHGRLLSESDATQPLSYYKITSTSTIHVIECSVTPAQTDEELKKPPPTDDELEQFRIAFGLAIHNSSFHKVAQRLGQRENLENIVATCPALGKDPVACAFLTKPELLYSLMDPNTLKYVHERHPGLYEAAYHIVAAVHEEKPTPKSDTQPTGGSTEDAEVAMPFAYNLGKNS